MDTGKLIVTINADSEIQPVKDAFVEILDTDYNSYTDLNGMSDEFKLETPSKTNTDEPDQIPYSNYNIRVTKEGLIPFYIYNIEIYPSITTYQNIIMSSIDNDNVDFQEINVEPPALNGNYAPTVENNVSNSTKLTVLPYVAAPETIIVHDGTVNNKVAANYNVSFIDYIKNVASSEIYASWPTETIKANVCAIVSFALNRVYTEWYRSKGYDFHITSVTSSDQKYMHGRPIFDTIAKVVDDYFNEYINFPGREEPFLAHYSDGIKTKKSGWLSQWGSKDLADRGYKAIDILKYYYGSNLVLKKAKIVDHFPTSFPGYVLKLGSCGQEVQMVQNQLNVIRGNYPGIARITKPDGVFKQDTKNAIEIFQNVFKLTKTGEIDYATWYKISYIYTAVKKLADSITS